MSLKFAFFDSGTGGIPYMQFLKEKCPEAFCVYLADTKHFPYGVKSADDIVRSSSKCVSLILNKWNPDAIIIACNTISVTSLDILRSRFPHVPIIGTVPAIKLAAEVSKNRVIGLLATEGTVSNRYTKKLCENFASDCRLVPRADTDLVYFVENKFFTSGKEERLKAVRPAADFFISSGCDTIVLGCTHFVHLKKEIEECAGSGVTVVDSREGVVRQALKTAAQIPPKDAADIFGAVSDLLQEHTADQSLFVTGFPENDESEKYKNLCLQLNIPWGGIA
ncbi:glutamate racemase [Treponema parvum]|uniref:glutamate racemase n=1 Tax=Treponema parvum TaxID=138851 RepID=UPI001AEBF5E4|nr:glutamate racemase [Treponema parvum]QTQ16649.1 glutamate racemase [Treponema parvum]